MQKDSVQEKRRAKTKLIITLYGESKASKKKEESVVCWSS